MFVDLDEESRDLFNQQLRDKIDEICERLRVQFYVETELHNWKEDGF